MKGKANWKKVCGLVKKPTKGKSALRDGDEK